MGCARNRSLTEAVSAVQNRTRAQLIHLVGGGARRMSGGHGRSAGQHGAGGPDHGAGAALYGAHGEGACPWVDAILVDPRAGAVSVALLAQLRAHDFDALLT